MSADSYLSVHTHPSLEAHELLRIVSLKLDRAEEEMVLAVMSNTGGTCREMLVWYTSQIFTFSPDIIYLVQKGFPAFLHRCPADLIFTLFFLPTFVPVERRLLQSSDCVYSESLTPQGKLVACRRDVTEILVCTVNSHCSSHAPLFKCIDLGRGRRCCSQIQSAPLVSLMKILAFAVCDIGVFLWSIIWLHKAWK